MRIEAVGVASPVAMQETAQATAAKPSGRSFMDYLEEALKDVSNMENEATMLQDALARGEFDNVHQVMIATQEAGLALDLVLAVRNQAVRAYEQIMQMPV